MSKRIVTIDFETYFDKDYTLSKMGPIEYIRDYRFTVLCAGVKVDDGATEVYEVERLPKVLNNLELDDLDTYTLGHNMAGFDAIVLSEAYDIKPAHIIDTIAMARWCGLARCVGCSHEAITAALGNGIKQHGTEWSMGRQTRAEFTQTQWENFKQYCHDDTEQCFNNFKKMLPYMQSRDAIMFIGMTADMATRAKLRLDSAMLRDYIKKLNADADASMQNLLSLFHFASKDEFLKSIRSADKFVSLMHELGVEPPTKLSEAKSKTAGHTVFVPALSKNDLEFKALLDHPDPRVRLLVETRLERNSSIELTRATRLYKLSQTDAPLPVLLQTFAAHTSRYSAGNSEGASDGLNMQNLSKRGGDMTLRKSIKAPKGGKIIACDSSQIEARMLAYIAGQDDLIEQFREGRDPYAELAEKIFNVPADEIHQGAKSGDKKLKAYRNVGKTSILSAGYGVGVDKYSDTLLRSGVRLDEDPIKHREMAAKAHAIYRQTNSKIVGLWNKGQQVVLDLAAGRSGSFGGPDGTLFTYVLSKVVGVDKEVPSIKMNGFNYSLRYPNLRQEGREFAYDYIKGNSVMSRRIYGAGLIENVTQGLAFQLLMWQACRIVEWFDLSPAANIHDCWIFIVGEPYAPVLSQVVQGVMSAVPACLSGFPVGCEVEIGDDYTVA